MGSSSSKWWLCASSNTGHSVIKCTSVSSAWPHRWHVAGSDWSWFLVILLRYHANSGVCPLVQRRESRVLCEGVKSFSWSLFTYVAWCTAGLAILLHLWASDDCFSSAKVHWCCWCGSILCNTVSPHVSLYPAVTRDPLKRHLCVTTCCYLLNQWKYVMHIFFFFPVAFANFWIADLSSICILTLTVRWSSSLFWIGGTYMLTNWTSLFPWMLTKAATNSVVVSLAARIPSVIRS